VATIPEALLDSNVIIAALVEDHPHHPASFSLLGTAHEARFAVAAHTHTEAYSHLTRRSAGGFGQSPREAVNALASIRAKTVLLGLTPPQTLEGIRRFSALGGIGPRLYDALIGEVALLHAIPAIVTWNTRHLAPLFPRLRVVTPATYAT
jgi:predicted nucleic acid-binding protein